MTPLLRCLTLNKDQAEQIKNLQKRIKELTAQIAWLNRQLFGRKTEKLPVYNPDMPDLFAEEFAGLRHQAEEKRDEAVKKIKRNRWKSCSRSVRTAK